MKFSRAGWIGASLAGLALAQPAHGETVVVKCTITSGGANVIGIAPFGYFKIGDGQWRRWDGQGWSGNFCEKLRGLPSSCKFDNNRYFASSPPSDNVEKSVEIDRIAGVYTAWAFYPAQNAQHQEGGVCERSTDPPPAPPPPPKPKF